jgi:hypothetical protein
MSKEIIKSEEVTDLTADLADSLINSILDGGVLEEIPIIGSMLKIYRSGRSIKEKIFSKQLLAFLNITENVSEEKRKEFFDKITEEEKEKLSSKILTLLEKEDEIQKSKWYAIALNLYIENKIEYSEFYDLLYSIERIKSHYTIHFYELIKFNLPKLEREKVDHFHIIGLLNSTDGKRALFERAIGNYELSRTGELFLDLIYKPNKEEIKKRYVQLIINETVTKFEGETRKFILIETLSEKLLRKQLLNLEYEKLMEFKITNIGTNMDRISKMYIFKENEDYSIMKRK